MVPMQALSAGRPDVLPGPSDATDDQITIGPGLAGIRGKDSVARMTWDGLSYVVSVSQINFLSRKKNYKKSFSDLDASRSKTTRAEGAFFAQLPTGDSCRFAGLR